MQFKLNTWSVCSLLVYSVGQSPTSYIARRLGPLVLGSHFNALLLGFVIIQVYQYFTARRKYVPVSFGLLRILTFRNQG